MNATKQVQDKVQGYEIDLKDCGAMLSEDYATARENDFEKHLCYIIENDIEKREITIMLSQGKDSITLPESWVYGLIEELTHQTHEWS